jgi:tetratricopeptide (TPR) repeat protein
MISPRAFDGWRGHLSWILLMQGKWAEAVAATREAVRIDPGFGQWHGNLGWALRELGRLGEAEAEYRTAIALDPAFHGWRGNLGRVLALQEKWVEAETAYAEAVRLRPDSEEYRRGWRTRGASICAKARDRAARASAWRRRTLRYTRAVRRLPAVIDSAAFPQRW